MSTPITCEVYRPADATDGTGGGVSSRHHTILLHLDDSPAAADDRSFRLIELGPLPALTRPRGEPRYSLALVPVAVAPAPGASILRQLGGHQFGGNFAWSSDSRFPSPQPIKIYDRRET